MTPGKRGMTGKHGNHWRRPLVERARIVCEVCGTVKELMPCQARQRTGRFCSRKCLGKSMVKTIDAACAQCGRVTAKRADCLKRNKSAFCSRACAQASKRRERVKWPDKRVRLDLPAVRRGDIEAQREYQRAYQKSKREQINARAREWARSHRDVRNRLQRMRRAAKGPANLPINVWNEILRRAGFKCLCCGLGESLLVKLEADHVLPVSLGGTNHPDNIQPLCRMCNASKGAKHIDYRQATNIASNSQGKADV